MTTRKVQPGAPSANLLRGTFDGPEFTSRAFITWARTHGIRHILIQPGRPIQNGYIESFNGKRRDEWLNEPWFETPSQARHAIAAWRQDYNEVRPHSICRCNATHHRTTTEEIP